MHKWILGSIVGLSLVVTCFVIRYGLRPETIKIIQPSNFETPERLAQYIYSELFQEFRTSSEVFIGLESSHVAFFDQTLEELQKKMKAADTHWAITFTPIPLLESFSRSRSEVFKKIAQKNLNGHAIILSFVNLNGNQTATRAENCELKKDLQVWLSCSMQQKLYEMQTARKVEFKKPIAIMEQIGAFSYLVYFKGQ